MIELQELGKDSLLANTKLSNVRGCNWIGQREADWACSALHKIRVIANAICLSANHHPQSR
jgi:hypothetical protein